MSNIRLLVRQRRQEIKKEKERELFMRIEYEHYRSRMDIAIEQLGSIPHGMSVSFKDCTEIKVKGLDI